MPEENNNSTTAQEANANGNGDNAAAGTTATTQTNDNGSSGEDSWLDSLSEDARNAIIKLRRENATHRTNNNELRVKVQEFEDRDKSEQQRAIERAENAERRAAELEVKALRAEVAAEKKLPVKLAARLQGSTREELEQDADELLTALGGGDNGDSQNGDQRSQGRGREWQGARGTKTGDPKASMNDAIRSGMR